jgi:hypothetical protein
VPRLQPIAADGDVRSWPHDAPRRDAGKFFGALESGGERVPIRAGRAAHDVPAKLVVSMANGTLPGPLIGHRPFHRKETLIVVGEDDEKRRGLVHADSPSAALAATSAIGANR